MSNILTDYSELIEQSLERLVPPADPQYSNVRDAVMYSLKAGGKRLRPALVLEFCKVCGGLVPLAVNYACAVEMIHTYSLIHDDLPCMDNDDFRRGKPSCHKAYGEEFALLAGDALQPLAFSAIALSPLSPSQNVKAVAVLSQYCGINGMIGGQAIDLLSENKAISTDTLNQMDKLKTGALIKAACVLGCISAEKYDVIPAAEQYAEAIGYAFQIRDDILDVIGNEDNFGKPIGSDAENGKTTFVTAFGLEKAQQMVLEYTEQAVAALESLGEAADGLRDLAKMLSTREI